MPRILLVAYHFPPLAGSSGIQRTLRFVQHLPKFGWQPMVLSAHPRAYERVSDDLSAEVEKAKAELESTYDQDRIKLLIANGGKLSS